MSKSLLKQSFTVKGWGLNTKQDWRGFVYVSDVYSTLDFELR